MPLSALALVLAGAALHATWNYFAKRAAGGLAFVWLYGLVSVAAATPLAFVLDFSGLGEIGVAGWIAISASAALHVVYGLVLQHGYRVADFSVIYPMARSTGPLFAVLLAVLLFAERPSPAGWAGIAAIVSGVLLMAHSPSSNPHSDRLARGLLWGAATGLCIAAYTALDAWAVKTLALAPLLYYLPSLVVRSVLLAPQALANRTALAEQWKTQRLPILVVGLLSPLAYVLVLHAMVLAPLAYVAPAREVSMLIALFIGARLLSEAITTTRVLGTAAMVGGVILLALAH